MRDKTMLVRVAGGDVIRRKVSYEQVIIADAEGKPLAAHSEPVTADDELVMQVMGDPIPTIVKIK